VRSSKCRVLIEYDTPFQHFSVLVFAHLRDSTGNCRRRIII
jgi:hypothetical protein